MTAKDTEPPKRVYANQITIRHVCTCANSTEHPHDEADTEHIFRIDGLDFPWHISEKGPIVKHTDCGSYVVVEIAAPNNIDAVGIPIIDERTKPKWWMVQWARLTNWLAGIIR